MAKDYAKATFNTTRARRRSKRIFFAILLVLVSIGVLSGWFIYQDRAFLFNKDNLLSWMQEFKTLLHRQNRQTQHLAANPSLKKDPIPSITPNPPIRFDFYTELPAMQVNVPAMQNEGDTHKKTIPQDKNGQNPSEPVHVLATTAPSDTHPKTVDRSKKDVQYMVQVGAYKNDSTASEMRVSILLAGFDAKVIKTMIGDRVIYRIQQGPYSSLDRAKIAQKKLQAKGFDGVVQKIN